jgi:hypothetical protein
VFTFRSFGNAVDSGLIDSRRHNPRPPLCGGARTPGYLTRCARGVGTRAASFSRNSDGVNTTCVVPSCHGGPAREAAEQKTSYVTIPMARPLPRPSLKILIH